MTSFTTLEFANAIAADGERRWLYGHPYRTAPRERGFIGIRVARAAARRDERSRSHRVAAPAAGGGLAT